MKPIDWAELIGTARERALHLELRDQYAIAPEESPVQRWLATGTADLDPDGPYWSEWTAIMRAAVARGTRVQRARVVSLPPTDYIRWEHAITATNLLLGEEVRWLDRRSASILPLVGNDFWLLDSHTVLFTHFTGGGDRHPLGHEIRHDRAAVEACERAFAAVWSLAVEHEHFRLDRGTEPTPR